MQGRVNSHDGRECARAINIAQRGKSMNTHDALYARGVVHAVLKEAYIEGGNLLALRTLDFIRSEVMDSNRDSVEKYAGVDASKNSFSPVVVLRHENCADQTIAEACAHQTRESAQAGFLQAWMPHWRIRATS